MYLAHADTNANPCECTCEYNHTQAYMLTHDTREEKQAHGVKPQIHTCTH